MQHSGVMDGGVTSLSLVVVPGSATGPLAGLRGRMEIQVTDGEHRYVFEYELDTDQSSTATTTP